jgi:phosphoenolpyruvate carboxylase
MLPAWLGSDEALAEVLNSEKSEVLDEMFAEWPFFKTHIDMLEMVVAKGDARIARYYDQLLVPEEFKPLGHTLRHRFLDMIDRVNEVKKQTQLQVDTPQLVGSLNVRNPYTDPLHYLQAELLRRDRLATENEAVSPRADGRKNRVEMSLKVTMAGIAAGIRNTG